jgi:signal transduction histidine kinase
MSVFSTLSLVAKHRKVDLQWEIRSQELAGTISDGSTLSAAVSNLVLNAIEVSTRVIVQNWIDPEGNLHVVVTDNGPGPPDSIVAEMFDPFITSKPEGLGLGLPVVQRAAEKFNGRVEWKRKEMETEFHWVVRVDS